MAVLFIVIGSALCFGGSIYWSSPEAKDSGIPLFSSAAAHPHFESPLNWQDVEQHSEVVTNASNEDKDVLNPVVQREFAPR